nr:MAG TPA: hypothetical protein [Caudoviricetes sp.]
MKITRCKSNAVYHRSLAGGSRRAGDCRSDCWFPHSLEARQDSERRN